MLRLSLVIFASLILSGCETMQAVDRGLYEAADTVTQKDYVTGERSLSLQDRKDQIELGNRAAQASISKYDKINEAVDASQYSRAKNIFDRVHSVSHLSEESWTLVLVPDDSFNAFVTGGTYIIVNQGLMQQLTIDDEVAAVMGHELGHVAANHVFEHRTHNLAASLTKSKSAKSDSFNAAFSHEDEREADRIGILYSALAGYDPRAAGRVWKHMFDKSGNYRITPGGNIPLHDHPVNGERAAETAAIGEQVVTYYTPGHINPEANKLLLDNVLWHRQTDTYAQSAGKGGGALAVLSTALGAYTEHLQAKNEANRQKYRAQLTQYADQNSTILEQHVIDQTTWGIRFQYNGAIPLTYMAIAADIYYAGDQHLRVVEEVKGAIFPRVAYNLVFSDERLADIDKTSLQIKYTVDDADRSAM